MNRANSSEFSQPQKSVFFGKGERGHSVTVRLDAGREKVTLPACDLAKDAALF